MSRIPHAACTSQELTNTYSLNLHVDQGLLTEYGILHMLESCGRDHVLFEVIFSLNGYLLLQRKKKNGKAFSPNVLRDAANLTGIVVK